MLIDGYSLNLFEVELGTAKLQPGHCNNRDSGAFRHLERVWLKGSRVEVVGGPGGGPVAKAPEVDDFFHIYG